MKSNQSWALSTTSTWQCGPPPNPAAFRPVELSPWPGWFGSADAADASPKEVSTTTVDTTNARFIVCSLPGMDSSHGYYVTHPRADSSAGAQGDGRSCAQIRSKPRGGPSGCDWLTPTPWAPCQEGPCLIKAATASRSPLRVRNPRLANAVACRVGRQADRGRDCNVGSRLWLHRGVAEPARLTRLWRPSVVAPLAVSAIALAAAAVLVTRDGSEPPVAVAATTTTTIATATTTTTTEATTT